MQVKRIITLLLVVAMTLGCFAISVSAADDKAFDMAVEVKSSTAVFADPCTVKVGDTVDVSVVITKNPGVVMLKFALNYDANALELVTKDGALAQTAGIFADEKVWADENAGKVWFVAVTEVSVDAEAVSTTGAVANFTFKVKEGFHGDTALTLSDYEKNVIGAEWDIELVPSATEGKLAVHDITGPTCTEDQKCKHEGCTVTGAKATGHNYGVWAVEKEPTSSEEGVEARTCANCGDKETRAIPMTESNTLVIVLIVVAVVAVLGGGAFCVYQFGFKNKKKAA